MNQPPEYPAQPGSPHQQPAEPASPPVPPTSGPPAPSFTSPATSGPPAPSFTPPATSGPPAPSGPQAPGFAPPAPGFGLPPSPYGQPPADAGSSEPVYGQPYGQPPPYAGSPAPTLGQPAPAFGQPAGGPGQPAPTFGQPAPAFGQPAPTFDAGAPAFGQPAPAFGGGAQPFGQPAPAYGDQPPRPGNDRGYGPPAGFADDPFETSGFRDDISAFGDEPRKGRGLIVAIVASAAVLLAGGGVTAFLLLGRSQGTGVARPEEAVNQFLTAVYKDKDAAAAEKVVCASSRDSGAITKRIKELRTYEQKYKSPSYSWSPPSVQSRSAKEATVVVPIKIATSDDRVAEQRLKILTIKGSGWLVCEVNAAS